MRVTKIIREHVERVVSEKYEKDIAAIQKPDPIKIPEEYKEWAEEYIEQIIATCRQKRDEFGITVNTKENKSSYSSYRYYEEVLKSNLNFIIPFGTFIRDIPNEEYFDTVNGLRKQCQNEIEDILVNLEMGAVKKDELDGLLAKYK